MTAGAASLGPTALCRLAVEPRAVAVARLPVDAGVLVLRMVPRDPLRCERERGERGPPGQRKLEHLERRLRPEPSLLQELIVWLALLAGLFLFLVLLSYAEGSSRPSPVLHESVPVLEPAPEACWDDLARRWQSGPC